VIGMTERSAADDRMPWLDCTLSRISWRTCVADLSATIYQHQARSADAAITSAIDAHAQAQRQSCRADSAD